jgi:hypothetical protein
MNGEELLEKLQAQEAEIKSLRSDLAAALEALEQANARIKQLEGQAVKDSHNSSQPPFEQRVQGAGAQNAEPARKERQKERGTTWSSQWNVADGRRS